MNYHPKIFISYSWDSDTHKNRVLELANRLREEGVDCQLDQYEISPPQGWARWMNDQLEQADYVLVVCTETYKRRATGKEEQGKGLGVTWEAVLTENHIYQNGAVNPKFIPVLFSLDDKIHIPRFLGTVSFYVLDNTGTGYEKLYRHLTNQPEVIIPVLGKLKALPPKFKATLSVSPSETSTARSISEVPPPTALRLDLQPPEGPVPLDSPLYVQQGNESTCYNAIDKPGGLINIKAPRQMGKTSLLNRILAYASGQRCRVATIDFLYVDSDTLTSVDKFLQWFCSMVAAELGLTDKVAESWQGPLNAKSKSTNYFAKQLLSQIRKPLVIGLDNIDHIFHYPTIAAEFFALLRIWHENGQTKKGKWENLRLVTVYSKEPLGLTNLNQSPFNVGMPVELFEWTAPQVQDSAKRHGLEWEATRVKQLMDMIGGHPYLVRVALYQIATAQMTLERLLELAPTHEGPYSDHLRRRKSILDEKDNLREAMKQVTNVASPVKLSTDEAFKLRSLGLVKFQGNEVVPLCNLYREYFRKVL